MADPKRPVTRRGGAARGPGSAGGAAIWSTVEEQLSAAGAAPGSALESLIRNNQELEILRPEEANDKLRLPPWIRVHWRKLHPDAEYSGPSGGYPLTLGQLYRWMIANPDLPGYLPANPAGQWGGSSGGE